VSAGVDDGLKRVCRWVRKVLVNKVGHRVRKGRRGASCVCVPCLIVKTMKIKVNNTHKQIKTYMSTSTSIRSARPTITSMTTPKRIPTTSYDDDDDDDDDDAYDG